MELPLQAPARQAPARPAYLDGLNPEQRAAVEAGDGPLLVLAGAGTGKTRVLTTRLAHLMVTGRACPGQILAVTFTNKAAREMGERVERLIGRGVQGMWLGTFHAIGVRMLRAHAELVGPQAELHHPRHRRPGAAGQAGDPGRRPRRAALAAARADRDRSSAGRTAAGARTRCRPRRSAISRSGAACELYAAYQERLKTLNACDFGDLLLHGLTLLSQQPGRAAALSAPFRADPGRRVPGHQRRAVPLAAPARQPAQEHHLRRRRRPVDLQLARCGGRQHPALRAGLPGRHDHPPRAQLPLDRPHPGRRLGRDRAQPGPPRQDALDRGRRRASRCASPACGTTRRRPASSPTRSRPGSARAGGSARPPSWCAPASRPARSRSASSRSACPTA